MPSTYNSGGARGWFILSLDKPDMNSTLVRATECLHPARIEVLVSTMRLQKPAHCITRGAICCIIVSAKSSKGNLSSLACSLRIVRSMVSKNFSKS